MALLDMQRNHASMFNIRLGEKVTRNGKTFPDKLRNKLRITSANKQIVEAFVDVYGGQPRPWDDGQWEAYLPTDNVRIMLLPGQSIIQWWELYKGSVCERRCEGRTEDVVGTEVLSGTQCKCPLDFEKRPCKPMTRLNFLCPDVNTLAAGSLVTHSKIAAETLPQEVLKAEAALRTGSPVPAVLRSVHRTGKGRQYVVPQVEIVGVSYLGLASGQNPAPQPSVGGGQRAAGEIAGSVSVTDPASPALAAAPAEGASSTIRQSVQRQAQKAGLDDAALEELCLRETQKYLDEADFSPEDANKVLSAITKAQA